MRSEATSVDATFLFQKMMALAEFGDLKSNVGMLRFNVILELECILKLPQLTYLPFSKLMVLVGLEDLQLNVGMLRFHVVLGFRRVLEPHLSGHDVPSNIDGDLKSNVGMLRVKVVLEFECVVQPPQLM